MMLIRPAVLVFVLLGIPAAIHSATKLPDDASTEEIIRYVNDVTAKNARLEAEVQNLKDKMKALVDELQPSRLVQSPVAFSVGLTTDVSTGLGEPIRVPYDQVLLNHGNAYNSVIHEFKVPVRGLYYFDVSMGPIDKCIVILTVNDQYRVMASEDAVGDLYYSGDAVSAVLQLEVGDRVWVEMEYGSLHSGGDHDPFYPYAPRNVFTGFLYAEL